jgi:hypothetical protein
VATYCLARELLPESLARVSAFLLAVYFGNVYFATIFLSEELSHIAVIHAIDEEAREIFWFLSTCLAELCAHDWMNCRQRNRQ